MEWQRHLQSVVAPPAFTCHDGGSATCHDARKARGTVCETTSDHIRCAAGRGADGAARRPYQDVVQSDFAPKHIHLAGYFILKQGIFESDPFYWRFWPDRFKENVVACFLLKRAQYLGAFINA
jgi:hypothetical protein